jgi:hypothetical protein
MLDDVGLQSLIMSTHLAALLYTVGELFSDVFRLLVCLSTRGIYDLIGLLCVHAPCPLAQAPSKCGPHMCIGVCMLEFLASLVLRALSKQPVKGKALLGKAV